MDRRLFLTCVASSGLAMLARSAWALPAPTNPKARVIVIGGGMGGATVSKYLRLWGDAVDVTLVERNPKYVSNILSSLVLTGQRTLTDLTFGYNALQKNYGVRMVFDDAVAIDPVAVTVKLASGQMLSADRIVMAPGIEFDLLPGLVNWNACLTRGRLDSKRPCSRSSLRPCRPMGLLSSPFQRLPTAARPVRMRGRV